MKKLGCAKCFLEDNTLVLKNDFFEFPIQDIKECKCQTEDAMGLSVPYLLIQATATNGDLYHYGIWDDLAGIWFPDHRDGKLVELCGEHWVIRSVSLRAFTDENDTLTEENVKFLFKKKLHGGCKGEIFILENSQSNESIVIVSETPDYQSAQVSIENGNLSLKNGNNAIFLGFCKRGEGEFLCREYYRHARKCTTLVSMSNTWGDRNGFSRVCQDFIIKEIDAAKEIGVDIVQIDDGWQLGSTADVTRRDALGRREFSGDFWELDKDRFPNGMQAITEYAKKADVRLGLWFAPDSHDGFALLGRDKSILRRAYNEWGIRFFKLDMFWIRSDTDRDRFLELLREIYSFGADVAVQLDVTRDARMNYLCGREFGTVFVENRYHRSGNSYPHRILRNLWMLSKYLPTSKFQFEMINPTLYTDCYPANDPFVPSLYGQDYLFATVMLSNPLFWQEMQFLPNDRRLCLKPIMKVWKEHRHELAKSDVMPIGALPDGRSFTGFYITTDHKPAYLLIFREVTDQKEATLPLPLQKGEAELLYSNGEASVEIADGSAHISISAQRCFAFFKINATLNQR